MEAVILAGGLGTRLKPYSVTIPKPLMPVGNRPILEIVLKQLRDAGVVKVTLAVNHLADLIMAFFGTGAKLGLEIAYSVEDQFLGTVGPLKLVSGLPDHFIVMNGDVLTDLDYADFYQAHLDANAELTVATYQRETKIDFGVMELNESDGRVVGFREKPVYQFDVSMGVYGFSRSVLARVPSGRPFGFDELVMGMLRENCPIQAYPFDGYWLDIGRPEDYYQANEEIHGLGLGHEG